MKVSKKFTMIVGIIGITLCAYSFIATLINAVPMLATITKQAPDMLASVLLSSIIIPALWLVTMILVTVWVAKNKDKTVIFVALLLVVHIIVFLSELSGMIAEPGSYLFTIIIFVTLVSGMLCSLFIHKSKTVSIVLLGISYITLVVLFVKRILSSFEIITSGVIAPVEGVIVYVVKPIVLLAAIYMFGYYIFVGKDYA